MNTIYVIKKSMFLITMGMLICNGVLFSQDCPNNFTYFSEAEGNGIHDCGEDYEDGNGVYDFGEDFVDDNNNNVYDLDEDFIDSENGIYDPWEEFTDEPLVTNINNDDFCFHDDDISAINSLITLNSLSYASPLEVGVQTWISSRLVVWVLTYTPNGCNGINQQLVTLPENIGNLTSLSSLFIEWNLLTILPESFSNLTSLINLAISNNYLSSLPNIGNLTNLIFLDLGYNKLTSIPESIGYLENLDYLWIFNNQLSSLPETICNLSLNWNGSDNSNYPYFASGANQLCDSLQIPDCVENSANFEISLDQFYYSFPEYTPQECCPLMGDMNGDNGWNVLDIVFLANCILQGSCADLETGCAGDLNDDGGFNVLDIVALANCVLAGNCGQ